MTADVSAALVGGAGVPWELIALFVLSLALSAALPYAVRPVLVKLRIMDVPNARSSHDRPILRGLGLAVLIAMVLSGAAAIVVLAFGAGAVTQWQVLLIVLAGSCCAGLLGLREDLKGLSVPVRSAFLLAIGLTIALLLLLVTPGTSESQLTWIAGWTIAPIPVVGIIVLTVYAMLFISSYINVANFMDGLNGISGFHGVIAGLGFLVAGLVQHETWLAVVGAVLAASFAGFLPWNLSKPGAFLGDVGSYLLGGTVAITSFAALVSGVPFLATIGAMVIPFGDVAVTLVRRVRRGDAWYEPHKEHAYQRIQQLGYSHLQASAFAAGCTLVTTVLGICALFTGLWGTLALLVAGVAVLVFYLALPQILPRPRH